MRPIARVLGLSVPTAPWPKLWDAGTPLQGGGENRLPRGTQFGLQGSPRAIPVLRLPIQKPLSGHPNPQAARLTVRNPEGLLHLPDAQASSEHFGGLLENRRLQVPRYPANAGLPDPGLKDLHGRL